MRFIIIFSVGLNLLLAAILFARRDAAPQNNPAPAPVRVVRETVTVTNVTTATVQKASAPVPGFHWSAIEAEDYAVYIANLRAVGCPERTIQHIVLEDLEKLYREKVRSNAAPARPLWLTGTEQERLEREQKARKLELFLEKQQVIVALLGQNISDEGRKVWVSEAGAAWFLGYLTDEKAEQTLAVAHFFGSQLEDYFEPSPLLLDQGIGKIEQGFGKMVEEFSRIGTPAEVEEGLLRFTFAMMMGLNNLPSELKLSGEELRQLMILQQQYNNPLRQFLSLISRSKPGAVSLSTEYLDAAQQLLGEERFVSMLCMQNPELTRFRVVAEKHGLPVSTIPQLVRLQQAAAEEAELIRSDLEMPRAQRRADLEQLATEAREAVTALAGEQVAEEYFKPRAIWLQDLAKP